VRATLDVDLVVSVSALGAYHGIEKELSRLGFKRDMAAEAPICRWRYRGLEVDVMPTDAGILGFANRWYPLAVSSAQLFTLPQGDNIRLIAAPVFIATKFEAYADRGSGDLLASHDLEDIVNVIDGRPSLLGEIETSPVELRKYLAQRCANLLATPLFADYLPGLIASGEDQAERADLVYRRIQAIAH
jgi:predicted nucleotidyltransferase